LLLLLEEEREEEGARGIKIFHLIAQNAKSHRNYRAYSKVE
jgi:hypothetical protein